MKSWMKHALVAMAALATVENTVAFSPILAPALRGNSVRAVTCSPALRSRLVLKSAEEDALEECMLVMKPCDPEDMASDDECIDEEALQACAEASEAAVRAEMLGKDTAADKLVDGSY